MRLGPLVLPVVLGSLAAIGVFASPEEEPAIRECRDAQGNVVYQDAPCPEPPRPTTAAPAPLPEATPARGGPAEKPPVRASIAVPRPSERSAAAPARELGPPGSPGGTLRFSPGPFGSPEKTWQAFVAAIGSGDRAAAAACLSSSALAGLGGKAAALPLERLRETLISFARIEVEGEVGPFWSIYGLRPYRRPRWIFFERTERGEWKIARI